MDITHTPVDGSNLLFAAELRRRLAAHMELVVRQVADLQSHLRVWANAHAMRSCVMVVDDSPPALCALVAVLAPLGVVIHAVTTDRGCASTLAMLGANPHFVESFEGTATVWEEIRAAVVVIDLHLGSGVSGLDVLDSLGRGPRGLVITSHTTLRDSGELARAAHHAQAESLLRTDTGVWEERLRDRVRGLLDEAGDTEA